MSKATIGWLWVAGQGVLLVALVLWPGGDAWGRPAWLLTVAGVLFFGGLALVAISALGLGALQAAVASGVPTDPAAPFVVQYNVVDAGGNSATAVRLVHLVCGGDEERCSKPDGGNACTVNGVCDVRPTSEAATELSAVQLVGPDVVFLARGTPYRKCTPDLPLDLVCDQVRVAKWRCRVASPMSSRHSFTPILHSHRMYAGCGGDTPRGRRPDDTPGRLCPWPPLRQPGPLGLLSGHKRPWQPYRFVLPLGRPCSVI